MDLLRLGSTACTELKNIEHFRAWAKSIDPEYDGGHPDPMLERFYTDLTHLAANERRSSVKIHRGQSLDIARQFQDQYFDVIYIDADHHYDAVLADLVAYAPKLKRGGDIVETIKTSPKSGYKSRRVPSFV